MNYCTKCGKEIPDGENKVCDECKDSLLAELEEENSNFKIADNQPKEEPKQREFKESESSNKKANTGIWVILIIAVLIILLVCAEIKTKFLSNLIFGYNKVGISIGNNNNNCGYANSQGDWIYYMALSEDAMLIDICRIKKDGTNKEVLIEKDWEIYSINVYKDYLYFIAFEPTTDENEYQNNKIYKMSLDGKELRVINDNRFNDDSKSIYVVNDRIYYIGENYNIYTMDLEGGDRKRINNNETGFIGVTDKYILFNDYPENPQSQTDFVTYIMNLDGSDARIINGERLYNPNICENTIYYVNGENSEIHKMDINGENDVVIYKSAAYNMNIFGDYIYYLNYKSDNADSEDEAVCIHRIKNDGTEHKILCELRNYTSFIDIAEDGIYYTDFDDDNYYINLVKTDGSETINLYKYTMDYSAGKENSSDVVNKGT